MKETILAKELINAVWDEDVAGVKRAILEGADPNWVFNGYPILVHAVYLENIEMVEMLIAHGAAQTSEALGFALEYGYGDIVWPLVFKGITPKAYKAKSIFGDYPSRFSPSRVQFQH